MKTKKYFIFLISIVALSTALSALAEYNLQAGEKDGTKARPNVNVTISDNKNSGEKEDSNRVKPVVVGKVSAVSGNIITVISQRDSDKSSGNAEAIFTVDATNAKILRGETAIAISSVAAGDNVIVQGTISGTNVVATLIRDGRAGEGKNNQNDNNQGLLQIQGNGQPVVAGKITAISGVVLTVANSSVSYTVDATSAKIVQGKNTILLSGVKTGDSVIVQGTVNGTSIVASTIIDQASTANSTEKPGKRMGFFGSIGQFFRHLFGF